MNSFSRSIVGSVVLHAGLFIGVSVLLTQESEWGVDAGESGAAGRMGSEIEVSLMEPETEMAAVQESVVDPVPMMTDFDFPEVKVKVVEANRPEQPQAVQPPKVSPITPKSIDSVTSTTSTTELKATGSGGARMANKADYDRNPPPVYPNEAKKRGEEGIVILLIELNDRGGVNSVVVDQGSGFKSLDRAALDAVRRWRFQPAKMAGIGIASSVKVPIRFELEKR